MAALERFACADGDVLTNVVLPAVRGHIGIRSGDLVALAREQGLVVPTGEVAARGDEWVALIERLAGIVPLTSGDTEPRLMPVVRDFGDLVDGSIAPQSWWQRLTSGGARAATTDERQQALYAILQRLTSDMPAPPDLARPLLGRLDGQLGVDDTRQLATMLAEIGRDAWSAWGATGVNSDAWPDCFDVLLASAREATDRRGSLVYGAGY